MNKSEYVLGFLSLVILGIWLMFGFVLMILVFQQPARFFIWFFLFLVSLLLIALVGD